MWAQGENHQFRRMRETFVDNERFPAGQQQDSGKEWGALGRENWTNSGIKWVGLQSAFYSIPCAGEIQECSQGDLGRKGIFEKLPMGVCRVLITTLSKARQGMQSPSSKNFSPKTLNVPTLSSAPRGLTGRAGGCNGGVLCYLICGLFGGFFVFI